MHGRKILFAAGHTPASSFSCPVVEDYQLFDSVGIIVSNILSL